MTNKQANLEIIDFVRKTTEAITVISESTKELNKTTQAIQEAINVQNVANAKSFESIEGKMDGLLTMFKYVIVPLVTGILALVGIKMIFKL
jgi:hypothetical protein